MKWIGQHIWDYISRFRSDVYLEDVDSGTIASGGNLGLDSNNKVVKSASPSGSIDLTSEVTGTLPVANGGTGATSLTDNSILTGTGTSAITAEANLTWNNDHLALSSSVTLKPSIQLTNTNTDAEPSELSFYKYATGADNDKLGKIYFLGRDESDGLQYYASIIGSIADATNGQEAGKLELKVAEFDGSGAWDSDGTTGLLLDGDTNADGEVDVTIGAGAASVTTIAGTLTMGSTAAMTNAGLVSVAAQTNITSLGTLTNLQVDDVNINGKVITVTGDTSDTFTITSGAAGVTTLETTDAGGAAGHLTLKADGDVVIEIPDDIVAQQFDVKITGEDNPLATFGGTANDYSYFILNEMGGNSTTDYFKISCGEHGATTISTADGGGTQADLSLNVDGELNITSSENKINKVYNFHLGSLFESTYSNDQASGTIIKYSPGSNTSLNGSEIYYLRTNGIWLQADADTVLTSGSPLIGVGLGGNPQTVGVLLKGFVRVASTEILNKPTNVPGLPLYISTTAGHFDFTAPSGSGDIVRIVGYAIDEDGGDVLVYFDPDKTYIEIA